MAGREDRPLLKEPRVEASPNIFKLYLEGIHPSVLEGYLYIYLSLPYYILEGICFRTDHRLRECQARDKEQLELRSMLFLQNHYVLYPQPGIF